MGGFSIVCLFLGCRFEPTGAGGDEKGNCCRVETCRRCGKWRKVNLRSDHRFVITSAEASQRESGCFVTKTCTECNYVCTERMEHDDSPVRFVRTGPSSFLLGVTFYQDENEDRCCTQTVRCTRCGRTIDTRANRVEHAFVKVSSPERLPRIPFTEVGVFKLGALDPTALPSCVTAIEECENCGTIKIVAQHQFEQIGTRDFTVGGTVNTWTDLYSCKLCGYEYGQSAFTFTDYY